MCFSILIVCYIFHISLLWEMISFVHVFQRLMILNTTYPDWMSTQIPNVKSIFTAYEVSSVLDLLHITIWYNWLFFITHKMPKLLNLYLKIGELLLTFKSLRGFVTRYKHVFLGPLNWLNNFDCQNCTFSFFLFHT